MREKPRFYFSLRSPYSWLAYRELLAHHPDVADQVEWIPFWEPDALSSSMLVSRRGAFPYSAMSRAKHLYILQDVVRLAGRQGVTLRWPIDRDPVWEVPHLAYLVAARQGRGPGYIAAAYRARWERGENICDPATVATIGEELGLDPAALVEAADDPQLREEGVQILLRICRDGVFGVPFFVNGSAKFWGFDRLAEFAGHLRAGRPAPRRTPAEPLTVAAGPGSDEGHAGGCG